MSIEQAKSFRDKVNADGQIQEEMRRAVNGEKLVNVVTLGREHGFHFTGEEARQVLQGDDDELSDFEMDMAQAAQGDKVLEDGFRIAAGAFGIHIP